VELDIHTPPVVLIKSLVITGYWLIKRCILKFFFKKFFLLRKAAIFATLFRKANVQKNKYSLVAQLVRAADC
jgi:hypothetical protein